MARPQKLTLDFFVHDADASNDTKVRAISRKHGNDGYATFFRLLEVLCKQQNLQLDLSDTLVAESLSEDFRLRDTQHLYTIIQTCADIGLFDKQLWESERIVLSPGLYRRYLDRLEERRQAAIRQKRKTEAKNLQAKIQATEEMESQVITRDNPVKNRDNPPEYRDQNTELEIRSQNSNLNNSSSCVAGAINARVREEDAAPAAVQPKEISHPTLTVKTDRFFGQTRQPVYLYQQQRWDANAPWKSDEERKAFQSWLTELVKARGKQDPVRYAEKIICESANGKPCSYWDDFKAGKSAVAQKTTGNTGPAYDWSKDPRYQDWLTQYESQGYQWAKDPSTGRGDPEKKQFIDYLKDFVYAS